MTDKPHENDDLLGDLDSLAEAPSYRDAFRSATLAKTVRVVRGRRRRLCAFRCAVLIFLYVAGVATGVRLSREDTSTATAVARRNTDVSLETTPRGFASSTAIDEHPWSLRQRVATALPHERIELLRRAGDSYLLDYGDLDKAIYCYSQVLELTSSDEWAQLEPTDTWLFAELKRSMSLKQTGRS
jgi:hypothetical protein